MAIGTGLSRLSGLLRILVLAYALGLTPLADAFNLANTVPNMVFDLVLGGVISATFVPIFVAELETRKRRDAWASISAVLTVSVVILGIATVVCLAAAPLIIDAFTGLHPNHSSADLLSQRHTATVLLRWFVPQIFFYGLIALASALLNIHRVFAPPMWVAIANNVVCIAVLVLFAASGPAPSLAELAGDPGRVMLLGLGSTAGVVVQALLLLPFLGRANVKQLWWNLTLKDRAIKATAKLASWTLGLVVCNQIALFIILALAFGLGGTGQVSAYSYAWIFFQTPYAVISISFMSAITPELASAYAKKDVPGWRNHFGQGLRQMLVLIIPLSMLLFLLAKPLVELLFSINGGVGDQTTMAGHALAGFALGLPGFCTFQFVIRAMQTRHGGHHAFWLYVAENSLTVLFAVGLVGPLGVTGLALANSLAYSLTALGGLWWIKNLADGLGDRATFKPLLRVCVSSLVMGLVVLVAVNLSASITPVGLFLRLLSAGLLGGATYWFCLVVLAQPKTKQA
jgi:putative peptidoglycan lipid II flippase